MTTRVLAAVAVLALLVIAVTVAIVTSSRGRTADSTRSGLPIAVPDTISLLTVELRGTDRVHVYFGLMKESQYVAVDEALLTVSLVGPAPSVSVARAERTITATDFHREPMDGTKFELDLTLERAVAASTGVIAEVVVTPRGGPALRSKAKLEVR